MTGLTTSDWINLAGVIATFLAVIVALFGQRFWEWLTGPQLKFDFEEQAPYCRYAKVANVSGEPIGYWVRLKVTNTRPTVAKGCEAKLTSAEKLDGGTGKWIQIRDIDPCVLHWVSKGRLTTEPYGNVQIAKNEEEFLDVLEVREDQPVPRFDTEPEPRGALVFLGQGQYRLTVTVFGENFSPFTKKLYVTVDWDLQDKFRKSTLGIRVSTSPAGLIPLKPSDRRGEDASTGHVPTTSEF